jgi:hypothetical protein
MHCYKFKFYYEANVTFWNSGKLYGLTISSIFDKLRSRLLESYRQMNFISLRTADPASMEAPGILIGDRLWEAGRKAHRRTRGLLGAKGVPSIVGFALSKVGVWNAWLYGMVG